MLNPMKRYSKWVHSVHAHPDEKKAYSKQLCHTQPDKNEAYSLGMYHAEIQKWKN